MPSNIFWVSKKAPGSSLGCSEELGFLSRAHSSRRGPLILTLTLKPAKSRPTEERVQTDAISQANWNFSSHLDNTVLGFIPFPLLHRHCASTPCWFWELHSIFPARKQGKKGRGVIPQPTNFRALWLNQHSPYIKPRVIWYSESRDTLCGVTLPQILKLSDEFWNNSNIQLIKFKKMKIPYSIQSFLHLLMTDYVLALLMVLFQLLNCEHLKSPCGILFLYPLPCPA